MTFRFQKRRGIGNVITTLIILIASVVLGAGVIFFGGSMFQTNTQSESIRVSNVHAWVNNAGDSVTAFAIQNTGSKAISVNSISMRGLPVPTASWYSLSNQTEATATNINTELTVDYDPAGGVDLAETTNAGMTSGAISLAQGAATIVYVEEAGNINAIDAGNTYALQIQAGQATAVLQVQVVTDNTS